MHPALAWLFIATGLILLRLGRLVGAIYFGMGILAIVVRAAMVWWRRRP